LSKFLESVIDGTADLRIVNEEAKKEEFVPDESELEIERRQEAQRIALAHGGFADMPQFEAAILAHGSGADFHGTHGYSGLMSGSLPKKDEKKEQEEVGKPEEPIHEVPKAQAEAQGESSQVGKMAATGDGKQAVFEAPSSAGQPQTPAPSGTAAPVADSEPVVAQPPSAEASVAAHTKDEL
jgi:protein disulfide-isomerase A6